WRCEMTEKSRAEREAQFAREVSEARLRFGVGSNVVIRRSPGPMTEAELIAWQEKIDEVWEANRWEWRRQAREDRETCHRGRGDPDFDLAAEMDPLGIWRQP